MAILHEEFTDEEIRDVLRREARERAARAGHPVPPEGVFLRKSDVILEAKDGGTFQAAVSWRDA